MLSREPRCGGNQAYLLNCSASTTVGNEAIADGVHVRRVRLRVLASCDTLLKQGSRGETAQRKAEEEYSVPAICAEALCGLQRASESPAAFDDAKNVEPGAAPWMIEATNRRLQALHARLTAEARHV